MTGHNAEDIVGQVDWDDWPDFELFAGDEDEGESKSGFGGTRSHDDLDSGF